MSRFQLAISRLTLGFVLVAATLGVAAPSSAQAPATQGAAVLVGLKSGMNLRVDGHGVSASDGSLAQSVSALGVQSADTVFHSVAGSGHVNVAGLAAAIDLRAVYKLRLPAGANLSAALAALRANPAVVYAEPDAVAHLITTPNDPLYPQQWGLAQIGAPAAWSTTTGSASVAIAVIDSGLDTTHPDLAGQLWTNPGEIAGNGQDDDNDGFVDDVHGLNILNNNADLSDDNGHGTEVAGIAAAATDNDTGVAGVCWACKLMIVKVAQPSGVANYSDIAAGVNYAAQKGARVINLSLGGNSDSITLRAAVTAAAATAVVVGGAGNNNSTAPFYPAAYPDALAVAGTTSSDTKVASSNFGSWVDVTAPGEAITTTFSGGTYGSSSGTSLAAPFAAGLAGLLFSQHADWSAAQVRAQIVHTAHDIDAQNPSYAGQLGSGRIDAAQAVATAAQPIVTIQSITVNGQANGSPDPGSQADVSITLYDDWGPAGNLQATLTGGGSHASVVSGTASYGTLGTYQSAANGSALRINVASAAGFGASLPFTLNLTADGGFAASLPLTLTTTSATLNVAGTLTNTTWTNNRVYVVVNNIGVASGYTLTIQPGTQVQFAGDYTLNIAGTLIADGSADQPIDFIRSGDTSAAFITFLDSSADATFDLAGNYTGGSILRHAGLTRTHISLSTAAPFIDNNNFTDGGISGTGTDTLVISNNHITRQSLVTSTANKIVSNTLDNTDVGVITMWVTSANIVAGNIVDGGNTNGLQVSNVGLVTGNRVAPLTEIGGGGNVTNNLFTGLVQFDSGSPLVTTNTIVTGDIWPMAVYLNGGTPTLHGNNLLAMPSLYALKNNAPTAIDAMGNWWGTINTVAIDNAIYDDLDEFGQGHVDYSGYLTAPVQDAPAYVAAISIQPDSTLGIQTGHFDVQFSRPMDQSHNPLVGFGLTVPYTAFPVLDNNQWFSSTVWEGTYNITSLVPRATYTLGVISAFGQDGIEVAPAQSFTFTVDYAGQITDKTPPTMPLVFASGVKGNPGSVSASWHSTDPDSAIVHYRYAIGSTPGALDVVNWTTINTTTVTRTGLGLVNGQQYWLGAQAQNQGGLWSPVGTSRFVAGVTVHQVKADFQAGSTVGTLPLLVTFTNTSTGDFTASLWDFGDGMTSTLTSPTHNYSATGVYTVTLQVSGTGGSDAKTRAAYITVKDYHVFLPLLRR